MLNFVLVLIYETFKWHLLQLLICVAFKILTTFFARATFVSKVFLYHRSMANHKDYESPAHDSDICIIYFVFIFQCILMYYYFRFIRLLNASNCSRITFSFNHFIHKLFFLFKNASWYKYLARSNRAFWECYHVLIDLLFDHMLQMHSI